MKARLLRTHVAALMLLAPAAATLVALPQTAQAQARRAAAPVIHTLSVNADDGLRPGSDLQFALEGTPRSRANVTLGRSNIVVNLKETSAGMYRGTYTVRSRDRIDPTQLMTARVTSGNRAVTRSFTWPPAFQALAMGNAPAPVAVAQPPRIESFRMRPVRIEPGRELHYVIQGVPGANVTLDIPGVASGIAMREVQPGRYEAEYTVRQRDNPQSFETAVATLRSGGQTVTSRLSVPMARDNTPPTVVDMTPRPGEVVSSAGTTLVSGNFEDVGGRGVDPSSVRIVISGRDVTRDARITPREFSYRGDLPVGRYTAEVTARDFAGNAVNKSWGFEVSSRMGAAGGSGYTPPLPLQVTSPGHNTHIDAAGNITVSGHTMPWAQVTVKVDAVPPAIGNRATVAQPVMTQTVQADRDGRFSVSVAPRFAPPPGTRFDVSLTASHNALTAEQRLTLYQRG